jgi:nucleoside diphosphate kinase
VVASARKLIGATNPLQVRRPQAARNAGLDSPSSRTLCTYHGCMSAPALAASVSSRLRQQCSAALHGSRHALVATCRAQHASTPWQAVGAAAATPCLQSEPGTIRGDLAIEVGRNVIHGSDSVENGEREAGEWDGTAALPPRKPAGSGPAMCTSDRQRTLLLCQQQQGSGQGTVGGWRHARAGCMHACRGGETGGTAVPAVSPQQVTARAHSVLASQPGQMTCSAPAPLPAALWFGEGVVSWDQTITPWLKE